MKLRLIIAIVGILLPYAVRIPGGAEWLGQYAAAGVGGFLMLEAFNALAWSSLIGLSFLIRRPVMLLIPCVLGFGYLAWAHATLDLSADALAGIALALIPVYALVPIGVGGLVGYAMDRMCAGSGAGG